MSDQNEVFVRKAEAARRFGVQIRTLERWEKAGLFPRRVRLGPLVVAYRADELLKFAETRQYAAAGMNHAPSSALTSGNVRDR
jgi:predicted DNA-binding transcriptional regulator AlpA